MVLALAKHFALDKYKPEQNTWNNCVRAMESNYHRQDLRHYNPWKKRITSKRAPHSAEIVPEDIAAKMRVPLR